MSQAPAPPQPQPKRPIVAAFYFPGYHSDPLVEKEEGKGWTEWTLLKVAKPQFPGHVQPKIPQWGYEDESNVKAMTKKIAAAADHGVDCFIFDWYWYHGGPFLERPLDNAFLKANNRNRMKFCLMWANHDWVDIFPQKKGVTPRLIHPGNVTQKQFDDMCDHVIHDYFLQPNYLKIDGKPFFSFYEMYHLVQSFGGVAQTRAALDRFEAKACAAGLPGIHFNAIVWGLTSFGAKKDIPDPMAAFKELRIEDSTSYVWLHHIWPPDPTIDYNDIRDRYFNWMNTEATKLPVTYFPNVSIGWDPTPRMYDPLRIITGNTPARFEQALRMADDWIADKAGTHMITINSWNEWTEGSYLEPDTQYGFGYLDAVKAVFGLAKPR